MRDRASRFAVEGYSVRRRDSFLDCLENFKRDTYMLGPVQ